LFILIGQGVEFRSEIEESRPAPVPCTFRTAQEGEWLAIAISVQRRSAVKRAPLSFA
jgi:hypothetical protein